MKKVLLRAPLLTNSGYGVHSRQVFKWLFQKKNIDLTVESLNWGATPWIINKSFEDGMIGEIMSRSKKLEPKYDVTFQVQLPDEWDPNLGKYNVGITAAVETDRCNPEWIDRCNKMDQIVVPSKFTRNVLKRSGVVLRTIHVIPEWFNEDITNNKSLPLENLEIDTRLNFLIVSMLTHNVPAQDRKNLVNTVQGFCQKFKDRDDVGLVIKTCMGRGSSFDRKRTLEYFEQIVGECKPNNQLYPKIYLVHGSMTKQEMASLYSHPKISCYLSLTRGEGYGLPLVDSAAAGLPIIATNYSGHLEFLKSGSFLEIDYDLIEIPKEKVDKRIFVEGVKWAEPKTSDYFLKLDEFYNNHKKYKSKASDYAPYVLENYSSEKIMSIYDECFEKILC